MPDIRTAVFPGTFDPFTNGHLDLAKRAARLFDRVVIAVAHSPNKGTLFTVEERVEMIERAFAAGWGGAVTKTIPLEKVPVRNVTPRIHSIAFAMPRPSGICHVQRLSFVVVNVCTRIAIASRLNRLRL